LAIDPALVQMGTIGGYQTGGVSSMSVCGRPVGCPAASRPTATSSSLEVPAITREQVRDHGLCARAVRCASDRVDSGLSPRS
jgi:hypothetical protein